MKISQSMADRKKLPRRLFVKNPCYNPIYQTKIAENISSKQFADYSKHSKFDKKLFLKTIGNVGYIST